MDKYFEQFTGDGELDDCWYWEYAVCYPWAIAVYRDEQKAIAHRDELRAKGTGCRVDSSYFNPPQTLNHRDDIWLGAPFYG